MTSLAVAMTVLDQRDIEETVTISDNDFYALPRNTRNIRLKSGETATVGDLIYALLLENAGDAAVELAATNPGDAAMVETLGGGWVGEETLAIALYCALSHPDDFEKALLLSVNHSGDSDSTGAVCGNLMGMKLGAGVWPEKWKKYLELNELIGDMGRKLAALVPDAE